MRALAAFALGLIAAVFLVELLAIATPETPPHPQVDCTKPKECT